MPRRAALLPLGALVLLLLAAGPCSQPQLDIEEATWESGDARLVVKAEGTLASATVRITNRGTGELLGETTSSGSGSFEFVCTLGGAPCGAAGGGPTSVPCLVNVEVSNGSTRLTGYQAVRDAPADCVAVDETPLLCSIDAPATDLLGPDAIAVGDAVAFAGTIGDVGSSFVRAEWSFGGGADARSTQWAPGPVAFDTAGLFVVRFSARTTDDSRRCEATRQVQVGTLPAGLPGPVPEQPTPGSAGAGDGDHVVLAWNDLGMHCADLGSAPFEILPPFNTLLGHAVERGTPGSNPRLMTEAEVDLVYSAASNPDDPIGPGSINSTSQNFPPGALAGDADIAKSDFWDAFGPGGESVASLLFPGLDPLPDEGLMTLGNPDHGRFMPGIDAPYTANPPQDFGLFEPGHALFVAEGIPVTDIDDRGRRNSYPLMRVQARAAGSGAVLASVDAVAPVSSEVDCRDCHVRGGVGADPAARPTGPDFEAAASPDRRDREAAAKNNILALHDLHYADQTGPLTDAVPVLCASCHGSGALAGVGGPAGDPSISSMSSAMHAFHGLLQVDASGELIRDGDGEPQLRDPTDADALPLIPFGRGVSMDQNCQLCHPGKITQCFRGAMFAAGMDCADCHGDMLATGGIFPLASGGGPDGHRRPWLDEPRCESCHTGDAVDRIPGPMVRSVAFDTADPAATPLTAPNPRFAEQPGTLYRLSQGHGGVSCEGCHGSPHAIWPVADPRQNDNVAARQLQGHAGTLSDCTTCHGDGAFAAGTLDGPHGMHPVNDPGWIKGGSQDHRDFAELANKPGAEDTCAACHGVDHQGTRLSRVPTDRVLVDSGGSVRARLRGGDVVGCNLCHSLSKSFDDD